MESRREIAERRLAPTHTSSACREAVCLQSSCTRSNERSEFTVPLAEELPGWCDRSTRALPSAVAVALVSQMCGVEAVADLVCTGTAAGTLLRRGGDTML
jgi:hypothetical protein